MSSFRSVPRGKAGSSPHRPGALMRGIRVRRYGRAVLLPYRANALIRRFNRCVSLLSALLALGPLGATTAGAATTVTVDAADRMRIAWVPSEDVPRWVDGGGSAAIERQGAEIAIDIQFTFAEVPSSCSATGPRRLVCPMPASL